MFISTKHLVNKYGVDETIARFFVDREPPRDNLYWHGKLLYLRPSLPGYLFIPLIIDLLHRLGLQKQALLADEFITVMEQVGHISALEEIGKISMAEAIEKCQELTEANAANKVWLDNVTNFFRSNKGNIFGKLTTPFKSLHRGDVFLFSLTTLKFPVSLFNTVVEQWFALISTCLLIDDAQDIESDMETGDDNAFLESGLNLAGLQNITVHVKNCLQKISALNETMAGELERQYQDVMQLPHILKLLNPSDDFR